MSPAGGSGSVTGSAAGESASPAAAKPFARKMSSSSGGPQLPQVRELSPEVKLVTIMAKLNKKHGGDAKIENPWPKERLESLISAAEV
jgi:hypothetical protein